MTTDELGRTTFRARGPVAAGLQRVGSTLLLALIVLAGCAGSPARELAPTQVAVAVPAAGLAPRTGSAVQNLRVQVLSTRPHDPTAFTQGLLLYEGYLYESTGLEGRSSLRQIDPTTGEVLRRVNLDPRYFGEGLARV